MWAWVREYLRNLLIDFALQVHNLYSIIRSSHGGVLRPLTVGGDIVGCNRV